MTPDKVFQEILKITSSYTIFQCVECAEAIKVWLKENRINGIHLQITAIGRIKFIVSYRWKEGTESIAQTGIHQGIEVYGRVFDNLPGEGLSRSDWISDLDCVSGKLTIQELELF